MEWETTKIQGVDAQEVLKKLLKAGELEAKAARKRALRILIPAVIVASLCLIGIGILIGKFIL